VIVFAAHSVHQISVFSARQYSIYVLSTLFAIARLSVHLSVTWVYHSAVNVAHNAWQFTNSISTASALRKAKLEFM